MVIVEDAPNSRGRLPTYRDLGTARGRPPAAIPFPCGTPWSPDCWEASFDIDIARKAVTRGDTADIAGCLFRVVEVCAQALHGRAEYWLINEKDAVASAGRLSGAPAGFAERAQGVLAQLGATSSELSRAIDLARDLLADTTNVCRPSR